MNPMIVFLRMNPGFAPIMLLATMGILCAAITIFGAGKTIYMLATKAFRNKPSFRSAIALTAVGAIALAVDLHALVQTLK
jgi:hypothetical protein